MNAKSVATKSVGHLESAPFADGKNKGRVDGARARAGIGTGGWRPPAGSGRAPAVFGADYYLSPSHTHQFDILCIHVP